MGLLPLVVSLWSSRTFRHPLRWSMVLLNILLCIFLLAVEDRPGNGLDLALNGVLFTVYMGCCIHFWYSNT